MEKISPNRIITIFNRFIFVPLLGFSLILSPMPGFAAENENTRPLKDTPLPHSVRGQAAIDALGTHLDSLAQAHKFSAQELKNIFLQDKDLWIDKEGRLVYSCSDMIAAEGDVQEAALPNQISDTNIPLSETFNLQSLPGAEKTIMLDFDGHTTSGTSWNSSYNGGNDFTTPAYDTDGNVNSFSDGELTNIQNIWRRVAEDFLPFNVNVTTLEPPAGALAKSGKSDTTWGVRAVIGGSSSQWYGNSAGGVAYIGSFDNSNDTPVFVFEAQLGNGKEKYTADATTHEVGHALGLSHDGASGTSYYSGHGSGPTGWGPIMGTAYNRQLGQWSKGDYPTANNTQDDLAIIGGSTNGFGYRADDEGDSTSSATTLTLTNNSFYTEGIIQSENDVDVFKLNLPDGTLTVSADPGNRSPNLDILLELVSNNNQTLASSNDLLALPADITYTVTAGTYYLKIRGTGKPANGSDYGYPAYGSIGAYYISGSIGGGGSSNQPPVAQNDTATTLEDTAVSISVLANDSDPDAGDILSILSYTQSTRGTVTKSGSSLVFTPNTNYNGSTTFSYTVSDGNGGEATATVNVTVSPVNDSPNAVNDNVSTPEETAVTISVLSNDTDPDTGDTLTINSFTQPAQGTVTQSAQNLIYTPPTNFNGSVSFTYTITDGKGGQDSATVSITVTSVNDPPVAQDDTATTNEDTAVSISVLTNDSDPDSGDSLSIGSFTQPANGSVSKSGTSLVFTPAANFNGSTSFSYTVTDGNGGQDSGNVTVNVTALNDSPIAVNDSISTPEETAVTISVLANDSDPDTGDILTIDSFTQPAQGSVSQSGSDLIYTPPTNYSGTASFNYTVSDGNGGQDTASVSVTVTAINDPPVAQNDNASTPEDTAVTISVLANDTDPDGDTLTIQTFTQPANGSVSQNGANLIFTPSANYYGSISFTYTITDGKGGQATATVNVTVSPVNDAPIVVNDAATTDEETNVTISVLANDSDPDIGDTLSIISFTQPSQGSVTKSGSTLIYSPPTNFNGTVSFNYTVGDGKGGQTTGTVTVTVNGINDPPVAQNDSVTTLEDTTVSISVLANDTDPDSGDTLSIFSFTQPSNGSVTKSGTTLIYSPSNNFYGTDSFNYTVTDGNSGQDTASVSVTITSVNDSPVATNDSATTPEETAVSIAVLANDTDPDSGDTLSIVSFTQPSQGSVTKSGSSLVYTPPANYSGTVSFNYTVGDGKGGQDTASVTVSVSAVNDPPVAKNDSSSTQEDTSVTISVLSNDSDPDSGDTLSIQSFTQPSNGSVSKSGSNLVYTPSPNYFGTDTFNYTVKDSVGAQDSAVVTVTVTSVNDSPIAVNDSVTTNEDAAILIQVISNDSDPDTGDALTLETFTQPARGTVSRSGSAVTYTPPANFNGSTSFSYTISDIAGAQDTATVSVTVSPVNDAPQASNDSASTLFDTAVTIDVLANDVDIDGDSLTISAVSPGSKGSTSISGNKIIYTPNSTASGADSFGYTVSDGNGGQDNATVQINISEQPNQAPVAQNDTATTNEDSSISISVLSNDSDPDAGDTISIVSYTQPAQGTVAQSGQNLNYSPPSNFNGTVSFSYSISDGNGGQDSATVTVTVSPVNDAPTANNDTASTSEGTPVTISVLTNDSDPDSGDTLSILSYTQPSQGSVSKSGTSLVYTPAGNFNGTTSFNYTISDGNGGQDSATVTVTVSAVNDPPVAQDDSATTDEDNSVTVSVLANDSDPDAGDSISLESFTQPGSGSVTQSGQSLVYSPPTNFNGQITFNYTISDGNGGQDSAVVTITVNPVNDLPTAQNDTASTQEDTSVTISVLSNDSDPDSGDTLSIKSFTQPSDGSVSQYGQALVYTPPTNFSGLASFSYVVSDGNGGEDTGSVLVNVGADNDPPVAQDDSATTDEDNSVTVAVLANDSDPDAGDSLSLDSFTQPVSGSVTQSGQSLIYSPPTNFNGQVTFSYTAGDGNGGQDSAVVTITVNPVNDLPNAQNDTASTSEDTPVTISVLSNDSDPDTGDVLSIYSFVSPLDGSLTQSGQDLIYSPPANFNGLVTFSYTVRDGNGGLDTATVLVTVGADNDPPVAQDDSASTNEDTAVTVSVLANDADPDSGDVITIQSFTQASNGLVTQNGSNLIYTPGQNFNGTVSFGYTISDGNGGEDSALVSITVQPVNDLPQANKDTVTTGFNTAVTINALTNDGDVDGDPLTIQSVQQGNKGTTVIVNNKIVYTPNSGAAGKDNFSYTISDGNGGTASANIQVTITDQPNQPPTAQDDSATTSEDTPVLISVLANDTDPDLGDTLRIGSFSQPAMGTVVQTGSDLTYTPPANYSGQVTFNYTMTDGNGGQDSATVTVTIIAANDAPIAQDDTASTPTDQQITINVLGNDSDIDGDSLTLIKVTDGILGAAAILDNKIVYTPNLGQSGTDTFTYTVADGNGGEDTGTVTVVIEEDVVTNDGFSPTVSITDPSDGATLGQVFTMRVEADDNVGVIWVDLLINGVITRTDVQAPYEFEIDPENYSDGTYTLIARAEDAAGNTASKSISVTFSLNIAPQTQSSEKQFATVIRVSPNQSSTPELSYEEPGLHYHVTVHNRHGDTLLTTDVYNTRKLWDGRLTNGEYAPSGTYILVVKDLTPNANEKPIVHKMVLIK